MRIDTNTDSGYTIPKSNPFYNDKNKKGEIWSYGLRNPWRFSFDSMNGDILLLRKFDINTIKVTKKSSLIFEIVKSVRTHRCLLISS